MAARSRTITSFADYWLGLSTIMLAAGLANAMTSRFLPVYALEDLGMTAASYGFLVTMMSLSAFCANLGSGFLAERIRHREQVLGVTILCGFTGFGVIAIFDRPEALFLSSTLLLSCASASAPQIYGVAKERKDLAMAGPGPADLRALFAACWVIGPPLAGLLIGLCGFRVIFAFAAGLHAVAFLVVCSIMSNRHPMRRSSDVVEKAGQPEAKIYGALVAFVFVNLAMGLFGIAFPLVITNELNGTETGLGIAAAISAAIEIPIMIALGRVFPHYKHTTLVVACFLYATYLMLISHAWAMWQIMILQVFGAVPTAALLSVSIGFFQDLLPNRPSLGATLFSLTKVVGTALSGLVFAWIAAADSYLTLLGIGALVACFAGLLLALLPITRGNDE